MFDQKANRRKYTIDTDTGKQNSTGIMYHRRRVMFDAPIIPTKNVTNNKEMVSAAKSHVRSLNHNSNKNAPRFKALFYIKNKLEGTLVNIIQVSSEINIYIYIYIYRYICVCVCDDCLNIFLLFMKIF